MNKQVKAKHVFLNIGSMATPKQYGIFQNFYHSLSKNYNIKYYMYNVILKKILWT